MVPAHDLGLVSGLGVGVDMAIGHILDQIKIGLSCKKELNSLTHLVKRIETIVTQIQQYCLTLDWEKGIRYNEASAVTEWLKKLESLLLQASVMAQAECTVPRYGVVSRYKTSKKITRLILEITQHLDLDPFMGWASMLEGNHGQIKESNKALASYTNSASTAYATTSQPDIVSTGFFIEEPLIVGQENSLVTLKKLLIDAEAKSPFSLIGVVGKGGSGKSLILKTLFNSEEVRDFFGNGLLLWLTVSQSPSLTSLRIELYKQIAMQTNLPVANNMNQENVKILLNYSMQRSRFALFLDDVWEEGSKLLEELGLLLLTQHSNSKVIVSSRNLRTLTEMGVDAETFVTTVGDLTESDSWRLFAHNAFRYNNGNLPEKMAKQTAKLVCAKCGGLPLAIKVVGRAMGGITNVQQWELAAQRLPNAKRQDKEALYGRLRLSYDALGSYNMNLQMGFLYLAAAYLEDQILTVNGSTLLWIGEGLLGSGKNLPNEAGHDPILMGKIYINILADRCLIEPTLIDVDGRVVCFRLHDVLRDLAIEIAEHEENFYCGVGKGLTALNEDQCSGCTRIFLNLNSLSSLPESLTGATEICTLLLGGNEAITETPRVMVSMISLRVLNLSCTSICSLPDSLGDLKQLVYLRLVSMPIKNLPESLTNLTNLQILDLYESSITELPDDIHKLASLRCLDLSGCYDLQYLPPSISLLTSLQCLDLSPGSSDLWAKGAQGKRVASINDLGSLTQLKHLTLENNGETISEGTLGHMVQMEKLHLDITAMVNLPEDIIKMTKLKSLRLKSSHVVKIESNFCFRNLSHLRLWNCIVLEEFPNLHGLRSLRKLDIKGCGKLKRFSKEFGNTEAFPLLEIFSLVNLDELEELPFIEEGAMPSLKIFTMMKCEALEMLSQNYLYLKKLQKIRVYGCSKVLENLIKLKRTNTQVEIETMSTTEIEEFIYKYFRCSEMVWLHGEFWCSELSLFLQDMYRSF